MTDEKTHAGELVPLLRLCPGDNVRIRAINGGRFLVRRMSMLGIRPGVEARVVHGPGLHGIVLMVGGGRIALGHGVIEHILAEPVPPRRESATIQESRP